MENLVDKAIRLALQAHAGQIDKGGSAYILHPLRVALKFNDPKRQVVAILHDVIEDSNITSEDLRALGFDGEIVDAVLALTKKPGENYDDFINRAARDPLALDVKIADIEDNMNVSRLGDLSERDIERLNKYKKAHAALHSRR